MNSPNKISDATDGLFPSGAIFTEMLSQINVPKAQLEPKYQFLSNHDENEQLITDLLKSNLSR